MGHNYHRIVVDYEDNLIDKLSRGLGVPSNTFLSGKNPLSHRFSLGVASTNITIPCFFF